MPNFHCPLLLCFKNYWAAFLTKMSHKIYSKILVHWLEKNAKILMSIFNWNCLQCVMTLKIENNEKNSHFMSGNPLVAKLYVWHVDGMGVSQCAFYEPWDDITHNISVMRASTAKYAFTFSPSCFFSFFFPLLFLPEIAVDRCH